jgi:cysteine synthase A
MPGLLDIIGDTPIVELRRVVDKPRFRIFAKLEGLNPGGSIKDRPAATILLNAIQGGSLRKGATVIESSSGNMGIGLAQACRYLGLRFICVVDPKLTTQNRKLLELYGATLSIVSEPDRVTGEYLPARLARVQQLLRDNPDAFWPNQYGNRLAALAHHKTMREILDDVPSPVNYLFCSTSTCGTLRGCAEFLASRSPATQVIAVDAVGSVIFGSPPISRLIPGHGASIIPDLFNDSLAKRCVHISDEECILGCRRLLHREALLVGGSSGAVLMAIESMKDEIEQGACCVAIFPDRGDRYIDTIYSDTWVRDWFGSSFSRVLKEECDIE